MRDPDGKIHWLDVHRAAQTSSKDFMTCPGFNNGICHKYACGECRNRDCPGDHLTCSECPREWVQRTKERLERAQARLAGSAGGADDGDPDLT